ncbi:MAG: sulfite exporter TauE/SafE family protein [Pontibacterium sp.]
MDAYLIWALIGAGFITGFSKFSVGGMGLLILPVIMIAVPGPEALAVIVPMYLITDLIAVSTYRSHIQWNVIMRLLPAGVVGGLFGGWILSAINPDDFTVMLGGVILGIIGLGFWLDYQKSNLMRHPWAAYATGGVSGTFSIIANAAGPLIGLYLVEQELEKRAYISTRAWLFFIVNLLKVPVLFSLGLFNSDTLIMSSYCIPGLLVGSIVGYWVFNQINLKQLKWVIRALASIAAVKLLGFS